MLQSVFLAEILIGSAENIREICGNEKGSFLGVFEGGGRSFILWYIVGSPEGKRNPCMKQTQQNIDEMLRILEETYPNPKVALDFRTPWELLVAVILSAQCTDVRVNQVTPELFKKYPTALDVANAQPAEFEQVIKSTGFYRAKAKNILATAQMVVEKYGGEVPKTMEELLTLPGVARKTANVVLGNAYGIVVGIAIDTHMIRLSQRLRLVDPDEIGGKNTYTFIKDGKKIVDFKKDGDPVKIEKELMEVLPQERWFQTTYNLVDHGRAICKSAKPDCANCPINHLCPSSRV